MFKCKISYASRSEICPVDGAVSEGESWWKAWVYETDDLASLLRHLGDVIVYPPSGEGDDVWKITIYDDYVE